jgi:putative ABC transport system permease protein
MDFRDLVDEAAAGVLQRPTRSALTALGTLLGVATFVAVLGLTATTSGQISKQFTVLGATEVNVEDTVIEPDLVGDPYPTDAADRVRRVDGVVEAGVWWSAGQHDVSRLPGDTAKPEEFPVVSASPGAVAVAHPTLTTGRLFDRFHDDTAQRVALLGGAVAQRLGITDLTDHPAVFVDGVPLTVIGVLAVVQRHEDLMLSVIVPRSTALQVWGPPTRGEPMRMTIETRLGAAQVVGAQVATALRPDTPDRLKVITPPDPHALSDAVNTDLDTLFLILAAICLVIGAVGIANTTFVSVLERIPEIGLRRALGARGHHVALQFLGESAILGTVGGLVGTSLGIALVATVAELRHWTAIVEPWTTLPSPLLGTLTGLAAGLYPALRAARIQPIQALQR